MSTDVAATYRRFCERTLPYERWTHEAHLAVCWHDLRLRPPAESVSFLRGAIRGYNDVVGTPNTDTSGYHETLTRYYVGAVHASDAETYDELLADPRVRRDAPLAYWSRERLFGVGARRSWCEPDLAPLPWDDIVTGPSSEARLMA